QGRSTGRVDLAAQVADEDVDDVAHGIDAVVIDVRLDLGARDDGTAVEDEVLEEGVLLGGEGDGVAVALDGAGGHVEEEGSGLDDGVLAVVGASAEGAQPGGKLLEGEGLDEV